MYFFKKNVLPENVQTNKQLASEDIRYLFIEKSDLVARLTEKEISSSGDFTMRQGLGFHLSGFFDKVIDIDNCHLQDMRGNDHCFPFIRECTQRIFHLGPAIRIHSAGRLIEQEDLGLRY